jgi:hypothetical protein
MEEHAPAGALEAELVAEIAACLWRLQRARRYESKVLETSSFEVFVSNKLGKGFETLLRYMGAIERQLNRAIVRLRETQTARRKLDAAKPKALAATASPIIFSTSTQFVSSTSAEQTSTAKLATDHRPLATELTTEFVSQKNTPQTTSPRRATNRTSAQPPMSAPLATSNQQLATKLATEHWPLTDN